MRHVPSLRYSMSHCPDGEAPSRDKFVLFSPEDRWHSAVCFSEEEVRECLDQVFAGEPHPTIVRFDDGDLCRDVSDDFRPDEPEREPFDGDYCTADHFAKLKVRTA